jgi:menaquinone-dependent protoporphyrinogen oxidase
MTKRYKFDGNLNCSKVSILIAYATRYGATTGTAEEIAKVFHNEGFHIRIVNLKREKVKNIAEYELVIIGSGIQIDRWTKESERFLKKFRQKLKQKKVALFVSSGAQALNEYEGIPEKIDRVRRKYLEDKAAKYELHPISMTVFGGIWDFHKIPWWSKKAMAEIVPKLEAAHIKETTPGVYDTRNWEDIRKWATELAKLIENRGESK